MPKPKKGWESPEMKEMMEDARIVYAHTPSMRIPDVKRAVRVQREKLEVLRGQAERELTLNFRLSAEDGVALEAIMKKLEYPSRTAVARFLLEHAIAEALHELDISITPHDPRDNDEQESEPRPKHTHTPKQEAIN
jgi:hypothetical protein